MSLGAKVAALLTGLTRNQVEAMSPVERRQLADQCRRVAAIAEPPQDGEPKGLLANLKNTPRDE